jgi:hypothetical protein
MPVAFVVKVVVSDASHVQEIHPHQRLPLHLRQHRRCYLAGQRNEGCLHKSFHQQRKHVLFHQRRVFREDRAKCRSEEAR